MSYFLDPPALFVLGIIVYYISKRQRWNLTVTGVTMGIISLGFFMGGSALLYLGVLDWPLPPTPGPVWMFHTNITGLAKSDVPLSIAVIMLLIYPVWHLLGYVLAIRKDTGSFLLRVVSYEDVKSRRERPVAEYAVRRGPSPRGITRSAIEALGGMGRFAKKGDKVLVKINICGGNPQIPGSYTSLEVVDELVKMIKEVEAVPSVVDADMIWTKFVPVVKAEGWERWSNENNIPLHNLAERKKRKVRFNFGKDSAIGIVPVSKEIVDANVIISIPTMKTHLLTSVTLGMKNMYGTFPEENKAKYHRFGIEGVVFEVNKAFTPHLTVIDGTIGGEAYGPLSCKPVNFETVIASNDVVAADAIACQLMGYDPFSIAHIKKAHEEGLGNAKVAFDITALPYKNKKDGKWEKPEPKVSNLYETLIELFLLLPGMQDLFDHAADFVLFGLATLPIFRELTPEIERILNEILKDILGALFKSGHRFLFRSKYRSGYRAIRRSRYLGSRRTEDEAKRIEEYLKNLIGGE